MNKTLIYSFKLFFIPCFILACLFSCNSESKQEKEQASVVKPLPQFFTMATFMNPLSKDPGRDLIKTLNSAMIKGSKGDSTIVFIEKDSLEKGKKPLFNPDTDYNVINSKEELIEATNKSYNKYKDNQYADSIDFNKYFIFAVSHPPTVNAYNEVFLSSNPLTLKLETVIYPNNPDETNYSQFWMTTLYKIERLNSKKVLIKLDGTTDSIFLSLDPKVK